MIADLSGNCRFSIFNVFCSRIFNKVMIQRAGAEVTIRDYKPDSRIPFTIQVYQFTNLSYQLTRSEISLEPFSKPITINKREDCIFQIFFVV